MCACISLSLIDYPIAYYIKLLSYIYLLINRLRLPINFIVMDQLYKWLDPLSPEKLTLIAGFWLIKTFFIYIFEKIFIMSELPNEQ